MTIERRILVGRDVYASDDLKVGVISGVSPDAEFIIVARSSSSDLLVPMDEMHEVGGRIEIGRSTAFLKRAPEADPEHLTLDDRKRLEEFYRAA